MATLTRPGVEISQVVTPGAPTVLTPTLVPCVVGPCFQIVNPIKADGSLDSAAGVAISAVVRSSASIEGSQALSGKVLALKVNGGDTQTITFEVTTGGALFSHALITNTINKTLKGATAAIVDNLLIITSAAKGSTASIEILSLSASGAPGGTTMAYDDGSNPGFTDTLRLEHVVDSAQTGQTNYVNQRYIAPYKSLPSPLASVDEIVLEGANIDMFRFFGNTLTQFSESSAINWNSFTGGPSAFAGTATSRAHQPALGNEKSQLKAKAVAGSTSNILQSLGRDARIDIPLAHTITSVPAGTAAGQLDTPFLLANGNARSETQWPAPSGNTLLVQAVGTANYATSGNLADIGNFVGTQGNNIAVTFAVGAAGASWNNAGAGQTSTLAITYQAATTMALMEAALDAAFNTNTNGVWNIANATNGLPDVKITMNSANASDLFLGDTTGLGGKWSNAGAATFNCGGGTDPINFGVDAAVVNGDNNAFAWVCGAVNIATAATGTALGIVGETLGISIDGAPAVTASFDAVTEVVTSINNALGTAATASLTASLPNPIGDSGGYQALRIHTTSALGPDSTIQLTCNATVEAALFGGSSTASATSISVSSGDLANAWGQLGNAPSRRLNILPADYNAQAHGALEHAIQPGTVTATISGVTLNANVMTRATADKVNGLAAGSVIGLQHSLFTPNGAAQGATFTVPLTNWAGIGQDTNGLALFAELINTNLAAVVGNPAQNIVATVVSGALCFHSTDAGSVELILASTTAEIQTAFALDPTAEVFGTAATQVTGVSLTFKDNGNANSMQCTGSSVDISASAACVWPVSGPEITFNTGAWTSSSGQLTALLLGTVGASSGLGAAPALAINDHQGWGAAEYSTGQIAICLTGDSVAGLPEAAEPSVAEFTTASTITVSATKVSACFTKPTSPSYSGVVFSGQPMRVMASDTAHENGAPLSRIVALQALATAGISGSFANAEVVLSDMAKDKNANLSSWYFRSEGLVSGNLDNPRIEPEVVYNDLTQEASIKAGLNRNAAGVAIAGSAPVYTQYKALRKDVTAAATDPGLLVFSSITEVESLIGPISTENPLAFGLSLAFLNATTINIAALGVDETSPDAPDGTVAAYKKAFDELALKEVYAIAPLSQDPGVHDVLNLHVTSMSLPENKKERIALISRELPKEKNPTLVGGSNATLVAVTPTKFEFHFTETTNFSMDLSGKTDANGAEVPSDAPSDFTPQNGIYLEREGDPWKYLVTKMREGNVLEVETGVGFLPGSCPGSGGNGDVYYRAGGNGVTSLSDFEADGEMCVVSIRQAAIDLSGTAGRLLACEALAGIASTGYGNRRTVLIQPEKVGTTLAGLEISVPGHYLGAAVASMIGQQNPSQPFTNLPMVGFTRPFGSSDKFSENQMATGASGGIYWIIQDTDGGPVFSRHQLTTDVSSIKTRELSIVKAVDYVAKLIRAQVKRYIGKNNITKQLLESVSIGITAALTSVSGSVVASATLDSLTVDTTNLDTIKAEVSVTPFYPANYIKITIYV